ITESQLDKDYRFFFFVTGYPPEYQDLISKSDFLNQTIAQTLLLQEATKAGYKINIEEAKQELELSISENSLSREEFEQRVKESNFTMDDVIEYSAKQLTLSEFIEDTIFTSFDVSDDEIETFYKENKELLNDAELEEVSDLIKQELMIKKQRDILQMAIGILMEDAEIMIVEEPETESTTIESLSAGNTGECAANYGVSSSTVIFYHANWCAYCKKMEPIVKELEAEGYEFHYAETSEDVGTEVIECFEDNMESGVPQFICAGSGEISVGAMSKAALIEFAENCK
ncbi:thioredoxin domain-containing protein, partial [Nanoarchaeota archaeon]